MTGSVVPPVGDDFIVIEAEDMERYGFEKVSGSQASEGKLVRLTGPRGEGDLWTDFHGESGCYDFTLYVQDESDGQSEITVKVDHEVVATITLDGDGDGGGSNNGGFSAITIPHIDLEEGSRITLWVDGDDHGYEYVRIDQLVLKPCPPQFRKCDDPDAVLIDFENDSAGQALAAGEIIFDQFEGLTITAQRTGDGPSSPNDAMIFDSANPTGGDTDLATETQGNLLIISEDGHAGDPDDNARGGVITFTFDAPSTVHDLKFVDTEEAGGVVELFDLDDQSIATFAIPQTSNGGIEQLLIDTEGVARMVVSIAGSGAIDDLCYIPGVTNLPPDAVDDETIGFQNIPVVFDVLSNDSDPDMDPLEVTGAQVDDPADGTVVVNPDNTLTFTPDPLTTGLVTITYDISDGNGGTDSAVLSILIIPNANPTIQEPVSFSVDENELFVGNLRAVDPEFDPLTWSIIGDQDDDLFSVDPLTGELNFLAAPDFEDPEDTDGDNQYLLTVRVADEFGLDEHLILVTVLDLPDNPNTPPVATNDETFGFQDTALTFDVLSNDFDPDMDTLEVTGAQVDDPADGEVVINADDTLTFTPDRLTTGPVTITYDISDGNGGTDSAVFTIFVIPNANPTIQEPVSFSVLENELFVGNLRAVDAELDLLTWSIIGSQDDDLFSVDAMTGELAFLDAPDFENPADTDGDNEYLLTVQVADEFGTDQHQILVTVLELG